MPYKIKPPPRPPKHLIANGGACQKILNKPTVITYILWFTIGISIKLVLIFFQAVAGLLADARSLADIAREEASNFRSNFGYNIPLKVSWQHVEEPFEQL